VSDLTTYVNKKFQDAFQEAGLDVKDRAINEQLAAMTAEVAAEVAAETEGEAVAEATTEAAMEASRG